MITLIMPLLCYKHYFVILRFLLYAKCSKTFKAMYQQQIQFVSLRHEFKSINPNSCESFLIIRVQKK